MRHSTPALRDVFLAELRTVGFAIRPAAVILLVLVVVFMSALTIAVLHEGESIRGTPELAIHASLVAALFPTAVWKGEYDFRRSYLAAMPIGTFEHVLVKVGAGFAWFVALTAVFLLWMAALAGITGGTFGVEEMRILARDVAAAPPEADPRALLRPWSTQLWQWGVLVTAPAVAYACGTAVVLAGSRTRRWLAACAVILFFLLLFRDEAMLSGRVAEGIEAAVAIVYEGRFGVAALFAYTDASSLMTSAGVELPIYDDPPTLGRWLVATSLWLGAAVAFLLGVIAFDRKD